MIPWSYHNPGHNAKDLILESIPRFQHADGIEYADCKKIAFGVKDWV
jgi:hypothetical protein